MSRLDVKPSKQIFMTNSTKRERIDTKLWSDVNSVFKLVTVWPSHSNDGEAAPPSVKEYQIWQAC